MIITVLCFMFFSFHGFSCDELLNFESGARSFGKVVCGGAALSAAHHVDAILSSRSFCMLLVDVDVRRESVGPVDRWTLLYVFGPKKRRF